MKNTEMSVYTNGLREMADFFDEHAELFSESYSPSVEAAIYVEDKAELVKMAKASSWEKRFMSDWFSLERYFTPEIKITVNANRTLVCEKVKTGEKLIPAREAMVVEEFEWKCGESLFKETE